MARTWKRPPTPLASLDGPPPGIAPPWEQGHLHYARFEGDANRPGEQAEQAAAGDLGLWIPRLTAGEQLSLAVSI